MIQRGVRRVDDAALPLAAVVVTLFGVVLGQYLAFNAISTAARTVPGPLRAADFLELVDASAVAPLAAALAIAFAIPARRLQRVRRNERVPDDHDEGALRGARPRHAVSGVARIACQSCGKLADADRTRRTSAGIVCASCVGLGSATIECGACGALSDASVTTQHPRHGIVCPDCAARFERRPASGTARVECEVCRELVDAATTVAYEEHGITCADCVAELEAGPNRNAAFR